MTATSRRQFVRLAAAGAVGLAGCTSSAAPQGSSGSGLEMTIASTFEPSHILVKAADRFADRVESETDGDITVNTVAGGAYGSEDEIGALVSKGAIEAHMAGTAPFFQYCPEYWFFGCPFVMDDYEQLLRVFDSDLMAPAERRMAKRGNQRPIGQQMYRGFRHYTSNGAVRSPSDVRGTNLRLSEFSQWVSTWSEVGAKPTPVALDELYSALQTGTVDASEGSAQQITSVNLDEVQSHYSLTGHLVSTGNLYVNDTFLQGLDRSYRELLLESGRQATKRAASIAQQEEQELIDELDRNGMTIVEDVDQEAFRRAAAPAVERLFENQWVPSWDEVRAY